MGFREWFSGLFKRPPQNPTFAPTFNGYAPIYGQYGDKVYAFDVVQQVLSRIAKEIKKLNPTHIRTKDGDSVPAKSSIQDVLDNPNELMTTSEFLEKCVLLLLLNDNLFILPTYYTWIDEKNGVERRYYESLYPIKPSQVDFIQDTSGRLFVKFWFWNGKTTTIRYSDVIHIRRNFAVNEYMGGNEFGQPDHAALLDILNLNRQVLAEIAKAIKAGYAVNGIVKYNSLLDKGKTDAALKELEQNLRNSESGFLPLDLKAEFTPIERKGEAVDDSVLDFIDKKILRFWGVPRCILDGDYTKEQYEAFYQSCLEDIIKSFSQAFTKKLFTDREKAFGNRVELYPKELIFMTVSQTLEMINILAPTGALFENEKRAALGLRPKAELEGKRYMSLNWVEADLATQYQLKGIKNEKVDIVDESKQESITEEDV